MASLLPLCCCCPVLVKWENCLDQNVVGASDPYFCPLCSDLSKNGIMSIHPEAFSHMKLKVL